VEGAPEFARTLEIPPWWQKTLDRNWSAGIWGGNAVARLRAHAKEALMVASENVDALQNVNGYAASAWLEQWSAALHFEPWEVEPLFRDLNASEPFWMFYRHLAGSSKEQPKWKERVARRLENEWPGQLARCEEIEGELLHA
jgi:hypothetical protein